jgi:hypothetical protein
MGGHYPSLNTLVWLWMHIRLNSDRREHDEHIINVNLAVELVPWTLMTGYMKMHVGISISARIIHSAA